MSKPTPNLVGESYPDPRTNWSGLVGVLTLLIVDSFTHWRWYWCVSACVVFLGIAYMLFWRSMVDFTERKVRVDCRLWGRYVLGTRIFPFSDFTRIIYEFRDESDSLGKVRVGLRHRSGRRFWIRSFNAGDDRRSRGAEEFAWQLACGTDINIDDGGLQRRSRRR